VCFIFGGLLAAQLRAVERVRADRQNETAGQDAAKERLAKAQKQAKEEETRSNLLRTQLRELQGRLARTSTLSNSQAKQLSAQISELQLISGLVPVAGPGVVVRLSDNQEAAKAGGSNPFLPGIVHDFDLLQVVNELRAAKAEAIAVNGRRITGYSPIRCVGPVIYINWEAAAPPFVVQAVGDTDTLEAALKMPGGILDNLKSQGGLGVRITTSDKLTLPAVDSTPRLHKAKAGAVTRAD
jgi:uncharacterized protein YlxW (UPF0749 family)